MTEHPWRVLVVARAIHPPRVTHRLTRDTTTHVLGVSRPHPPPRPPLHSRLAQMPSTGTTAASTTTSAAAARARPRVRCGRCVGARVVVTACLVLLFSGSASRVAGVVLVAAAASRRPPTRATCATRMPAPWSTRSACRVWNLAWRAPHRHARGVGRCARSRGIRGPPLRPARCFVGRLLPRRSALSLVRRLGACWQRDGAGCALGAGSLGFVGFSWV